MKLLLVFAALLAIAHGQTTLYDCDCFKRCIFRGAKIFCNRHCGFPPEIDPKIICSISRPPRAVTDYPEHCSWYDCDWSCRCPKGCGCGHQGCYSLC